MRLRGQFFSSNGREHAAITDCSTCKMVGRPQRRRLISAPNVLTLCMYSLNYIIHPSERVTVALNSQQINYKLVSAIFNNGNHFVAYGWMQFPNNLLYYFDDNHNAGFAIPQLGPNPQIPVELGFGPVSKSRCPFNARTYPGSS
jgi:hypothetical protein